MSEVATWESEHQFYFSTSTPVTPTSLADSLLGLDGVLNHAAKVLGQLAGAKAEELEIELRSVEIGSYKDTFLFRLVFGRGEAAEKKVEELRKKLRLKNMDSNKIVGLVIAGVICWVAYQYAKPGSKEADAGKANAPDSIVIIENSFNQLSNEAGMTPEEFKKLLDDALKGRSQQVKRDVVRLTHPDGHDTDGSIQIDGNEALTIAEEVLDVLPQTFEKAEPKEREVDYIKKDLAIRALDLDRPGQGWAAIAPDAAEGRLPLSIGEEVDPAKVAVGKYQVADFTVVWRRDKAGKEKAVRIILHRVHRN